MKKTRRDVRWSAGLRWSYTGQHSGKGMWSLMGLSVICSPLALLIGFVYPAYASYKVGLVHARLAGRPTAFFSSFRLVLSFQGRGLVVG